MSTVARPRGPLPARVYWTRRLALLTLVLLVGWLLLRWVDGGDSGAAQSGDETPAAATKTEDTEEPVVQERKGGDRERTARIRTVAESFERPKENCDLTEVRVEPSVADPVYSGEPVQVTLRISSSSSKACSLPIDADHLLVAITSGRDTVWDSTKCEDAISARDLALQPRWSSLVDLTWSGRHSGRNCAPDASVAEPGTYTVEAAVLEGEPSEADFEVVDRPEPPAEDEEDQGEGKSDDEGDGDGSQDSGDEGADDGGQGSDGSDKGADDKSDTADDSNTGEGRDDTGRG
jgi:hypothetical protein